MDDIRSPRVSLLPVSSNIVYMTRKFYVIVPIILSRILYLLFRRHQIQFGIACRANSNSVTTFPFCVVFNYLVKSCAIIYKNYNNVDFFWNMNKDEFLHSFFFHSSLYALNNRKLTNHLALVSNLSGKHVSQKAEQAADLLYYQPYEVMDAVTKKGIPWEKIMDNVCGWSQSVSSITKYYFFVLFFLKHLSNCS